MKKIVQLQKKAWAIALRTLFLPATTLLRRVDRHLAWRLWEVCFGSQRPGLYPEVLLGSLVDESTAVKLLAIPAEPYNVTELELMAIAALTRQVQALKIFELGTADGRTTLNLAANLTPNGQVYTINLPLEEDRGHHQDIPVGYRFQNAPEASQIVQLWGNTRTFDFSAYSHSCQVVFIDADHSDSGVWIDSHTALNLVDTHLSIILWHDALRFGVQTALPRLIQEEGLPIYLIAGTNLAILLFVNGKAVTPEEWSKQIRQLNHTSLQPENI